MTRVIVVGGGIVGLAVAAELARRGAEVELLERNGRIGQEASWAAAGILCPQGEAQGSGPFFDLLRTGYAMIPEALSRIEEQTGHDVGAQVTGMFALAFTEEDESRLASEGAWQRAAGLEVEEASPEDLRREEPAVDGAVRRALWYPQAMQADVRRFVEGYAALAEREGARIRTGVSVRRFLIEGRRAVGVEHSAGRSLADGVVNCAGSWAGFDGSLPFAVPAVPAKGQILQLATREPLVRRILHAPRGYLVQRSATELIAGTTVEYVGYDKRATEEGARAIREGIREISSRTAALPVAARWAGLRPDTPDHLPVLGRSPVEGLFLASGHFRNGVILAPLTGRIIADLALRGDTAVDLSAFSVERFLAKRESIRCQVSDLAPTKGGPTCCV